MHKLIVLLFSALIVLAGCSNDQPKEQEQKQKALKQTEEKPQKETVETDDSVEGQEIDTSMYEYAKNVDVTDAIDVNEHITLIIEMNDSLQPGLAFQHATNQTYDFLEQDAIKGAKTVGINIILNGNKIAMYTVNVADFKTNDDEPMAQLVLDASTIEMLSPEVKEYAEIMDLKLKEE
ncbi:hypothetical protein [Lederbergia citri]|uniref:Lipoprotein n=1 Tax=Lederbergia citri TaxID=2833580 RepID=A0A942TD60_9BACI|nr:hypothetical protein [Lederbergia citri]MBS4194092.1 hypothetical protein [Lederbergia citri]